MEQACWQLVADRGSMPSKVYSIAMIQAFSNKRFVLKEGRTILGRDESCCDIVLPGIHVSRKHAELIIEGGVVRVRDLNSSNGTYVNGRPIREILIEPGDQICFDTITLTLFAPDQDPDETVIYTRPVAREREGTFIRDPESDGVQSDACDQGAAAERIEEGVKRVQIVKGLKGVKGARWHKAYVAYKASLSAFMERSKVVLLPVTILIASVATVVYIALG